MHSPLPILSILPRIREILSKNNLLILQAPPGAGKSTLLPLELRNEPWLKGKKILMLEPRRLATRSVAMRMADVLQEEMSATVGYRIRFDNKIGKNTRIEVVTEGILTRMLQNDNSLEEYGVVIFDEFHERSIHADLALALCYQAQQILRPDLRILIMSATLDGDSLSSALHGAPVLRCEGRQFPVSIHYLNAPPREVLYLHTASAIRKALSEKEGDVLAFLPGRGEILRTARILEEAHVKAKVHTLYGDLSPGEQQRAILPDPGGNRKIILATSIAETSLTIEGVRIVIDSGYSRVPRFDLRTGLTHLETVKVTIDTADQRAGRAGRLEPGTCYRLWTEGTHIHLNAHRNPEILDADLAPLLLELSQWGVQDTNELTWVTAPQPSALRQADELLHQLGALSAHKITARGKEMLRLPTHPRIAHLLLEAKTLTALATDIAALLEERDPLQNETGTDLCLRIEALRKWRRKEPVNADRTSLERIERLASSWRKLLKTETDNSMPAEKEVGRLLSAAYPERIAKQLRGNNAAAYRMANGRIVKLPAHDPLLREEWLSVAHLDAGTSEGKIFLAAPLDPEDLEHLAQHREVITWDTEKGMITAYSENYIGNTSLQRTALKIIPEAARLKVLCQAIRSEGFPKMLNWTEETTNWQKRIMSISVWRGSEERWPDVREDCLMDTLENWLAPWLSGLSKREELMRMDLNPALQSLLSWDLNRLSDKLAPPAIKVPSGSMIRLNYFMDGSAPEMPVRLQEVFGLIETPTVNEGRTKVILHLLSPARRPVQVTQDLHSFWKNTYPEVRRELRLRYPRHSWPEDPLNAIPRKGPNQKGPPS